MPLGCFTRVELPQASFVGRLLGRRPKENCYIEVQNLLATRPVNELTAAEVENLLSDYVLPRAEANPRLTDFYAAAVRHLANDGELSESDRAELKQLRYVFGLGDEQADAVLKVLQRAFNTAIADRRFSERAPSDNEGAQLPLRAPERRS